jgi:SMI1 / KNR4 family (SUKH-1)
MSDTTTGVLGILLIFVGLPFLILKVRDRANRALRDYRNRPERQTVIRQDYEQRILTPDWAYVERHLQRPVSRALRELYADHVLVASRDVHYSMGHSISTFDALDEQAIADNTAWLPVKAIAFATTDAGDPIYLRSGPSEADKVYVTYHDGGDTEILAESVSEMLEVLRQRSRT